jgi:hypothetical protein
MVDWSPQGQRFEARRWRLINEAHLDLYLIWRQMAGLGGSPLGDLFGLAGQPGSAALFQDFRVLGARARRLKQQGEFFKGATRQ